MSLQPSEILEAWQGTKAKILHVPQKESSKYYIMPRTPATGILPLVNVGCGTAPLDTFINCDIAPGERVEKVFDCQQEWPFVDNGVGGICAFHILEHLDNPIAFFNEAWRVLHPEGALLIRVPHAHHSAHVMADLTHKRPWAENSFFWFQPNLRQWSHNLSYPVNSHCWSTKIIMHVLEDGVYRKLRWLPYSCTQWTVEHLWNVALELGVWMRKVITDEVVTHEKPGE